MKAINSSEKGRLLLRLVRVSNILLLVFCIWTAVIFFLKSAGLLQLEFLAFKLDAAHFLSRAIVCLLIIFFWMWYTQKKQFFKGELERQVSILLLLLTLTLDNFGNLFGWYRIGTEREIPNYDKFVHFINGGLFTGYFYLLFKNIYKKAPFSLILIATLGITTTFGAMFEVFELATDVIWGTTMVGGVEDIIIDLTMNISGSLLAILLITSSKNSK